MIIEAMQCDTCTKQFPIGAYKADPLLGPMHWPLPDEWITLFHGRVTNSIALHFCSHSCLRDWTEKEIIAREPKEIDHPVRRLILTMSEDILANDSMLGMRADAVISVVKHIFPNILTMIAEKARTVGPFREILFVVRDAEEKHVEWAKDAKKSGLIDSYIYDYDPEVQP